LNAKNNKSLMSLIQAVQFKIVHVSSSFQQRLCKEAPNIVVTGEKLAMFPKSPVMV
jgi:hypothetical protein